MITALIAAVLLTEAPQPAPELQSKRLAEAAHALSAGRLDQARLMIADAVKAGAAGQRVDTLLADLAFEARDDARALAAYGMLIEANPNDARMVERAGIAALRLRENDKAGGLLRRSVTLSPQSWRGWNALGVLADRRGDWEGADEAYGKAAALAPGNGEIANNHGWSHALRGQWGDALPRLERAAELEPESQRIAANLDLVRSALAHSLPARRRSEAVDDWAARLNDAGVAALAQGDRARAIAAFSRALEAHGRWFERAANNLAMAESRQ